MATPLRVLVLEDYPPDSDLLARELRRAGFELEWRRATTEAEYLAALEAPLDLILADDALPAFGAMRALQILRTRELDIPLIVVTESAGEEAAIECVRLGAADFLFKERPARLGTAVVHALDQRELRAHKRKAEAALYESEERFRMLFERSPDAIILIDPHHPQVSWPIVDCNDVACRMNGYTRDELIGHSIDILNTKPARSEERAAYLERLRREGTIQFETIHRRKDGSCFSIEILSSLISVSGRELVLGIDRDISERKQAEEALRESEERFRSAYEYAPTGMALVGLDGRWLQANRALCDFIGYTEQELLATTFQAITHPDDLEIDLSNIRSLLADEILSYQMEKRYFHKQGATIWVLLSVSLVRDAQRQPRYFISQIQDITERKQTDAARSRLAAIVDSSGDAIIGKTLDGVVISWNAGAEQMYGYATEEMIGRPITILLLPDRPDEQTHILDRIARGERISNYETMRIRKDGRRINVSLTISPIKDVSGVLTGISVIARDISERKRAEQTLRQKTGFVELLQTVAAAANQATSLDQALQTAVDQICRHIGWPVGHVYVPDLEIAGALIPTSIWHLEDAQRFATFRKITEVVRLARGIGLPGQVMASRKPAWISDMILDISTPRTRLIQDIGVRSGFALPVLLGDEVAAVLEFFAVEKIEPDEALLDVLHHVGTQLGRVVERMRGEAALRESEERFRILFEHSPDAIILIDPHHPQISWPIVECNDIACRMNGYTRDELIGQPINILNVTAGSEKEEFAAALARIRHAGTLHYEVMHRRKDGTLFPIEVRTSLIYVSGRELILGIDRDITERKRAEESLRAAEAKYRTLVEQIPAIIYTAAIDEHSSTYYVSPQIETILGFSPEEWLVDPQFWLKQVHPDDRALVLAAVNLSHASEAPIPVEYRSFTRDGRVVWLQDAGQMMRDEAGQPLFVQGIMLDITELKRTEEALRTAEAKYRTLVEQIPAIIYTAAIDERSSTRYVSPQIEAILGYSPEEWVANSDLWFTQVHPGDRARVLAAIGHAHASDAPAPLEYRLFTRDGRVVWLRDAARVVRDESGQPLFLQGIMQDITDRKLSEEALARYQLLSEHARDIILFLRDDGRIIEANQAALVSYGYTRDELLTHSIYDLRPAEAQREVAIRMAQVDDVGILYEATHRRKNGRLFPVEIGSRGVVIGSERVIVSIIRDITSRKQAEQRSVVFAALGRQLASATTAKAAARVIADVADDLIGWDAFVLQLYSAETNSVQRVLSYDIVDGRRTELVSPAPGPPSPMAQRVFTAGPQLLLHDDSSFDNSELVPFGDDERRSASLMFVPIYYGATVIGLLSIQSYTPLAYTAENLDTLQSLADHCSGALERIRVGESLRESERLYRTLASNFPNGAVVLFDHDLRFTVADGAGLADIGLSPERLEGHTLWEIYPPEASAVNEPIFRAALAGTPSIREITIGDLTLVIHTLPVRDEHGEIIAGMLMSQDITERKRMEHDLIEERALLARRVDERTADLSAANAELARTARLKDEFLASMSHELRTPLNAVLGLSEALQEEVYGPLNERQHRSLQSIEESGRHLLALINDMLDLAKIGAGKMELELEPVPLEMICQASLRLIKELAQKKRLSIEMTFDPAVTLLTVDARRLKQILVNLLSNAVKFTPAGRSIGLEVSGDAARQAVDLTVWDTGIGIAQDQMALLFQSFVQLDSRLARQYEGSGLGLALVYRMVEMHGGSIAVTSTLDRGSRFTVSLPWRHANNEDAEASALAPELVAIDQAMIRHALIVEDSPTTADQITRYLNELGVAIITLPYGGDAVAQAIAEQPDLIILDILLPDITGWEVLAQLKAEPRTQAIPVLLMSVIDDRTLGLARGAAEYLVKPVTRADIQRVLHTLACGEDERSAQRPASQIAAHTSANLPPVVLLAEDNEANIKVISDYLSTRGYQMVVARNGAEAIARTREVRPAIVLMDIQMPDMDGLEATRRIRADDGLAAMPIITLTALAMPGDRERSLAAGANDYLSKPVSLKGLAALIEAHLRLHPSQQRNH